jgi:CheY-like chemotaxis protein
VGSSTTRVMIIDDDPLIRTLLVSTLRKECFVSVASDGAEGFHKAHELKPDVAVIDVNMPGWDGLKTLAAFRGDKKLCDVKIIMLTADASQQTVTAAVRGGANDYLIKTSFSKADFYRKLNHLVPGTIRSAPLTNEPGPSQLAESVAPQGSASEAFGLDADADPGSAFRASDAARAATADGPLTCVNESLDLQLQVMIDGWE